jgi:hypothetical protein
MGVLIDHNNTFQIGQFVIGRILHWRTDRVSWEKWLRKDAGCFNISLHYLLNIFYKICLSAAVHVASVRSQSASPGHFSETNVVQGTPTAVGDDRVEKLISNGYTVAYIDTCNSFSSSRIAQIHSHIQLLQGGEDYLELSSQVCSNFEFFVPYCVFLGTFLLKYSPDNLSLAE